MIKNEEEYVWADFMRLEHGATCYMCRNDIPAGTTVNGQQERGYGFVWGSDGYYPNGASAMYACWECRDFWIDEPEEEEIAVF